MGVGAKCIKFTSSGFALVRGIGSEIKFRVSALHRSAYFLVCGIGVCLMRVRWLDWKGIRLFVVSLNDVQETN